MVKRSTCIGLGLCAWLSASLLSGCNEVLDIEQAHLDTSSPVNDPASSTGIQYYPDLDTCAADVDVMSCAPCIQSTQACGPGSTSPTPAAALLKCQLDKTCRKAAARYSACLGQDCKGSSGVCFEQGLFDPVNPAVDSCLDHCAADCAGSPILSTRQLYCGCMMENCSGKFATLDDCAQKTKNEDLDTLVCRWTHCEIAPDDLAGGHCEHAVGMTFCMDGQVPPRATACRDKGLTSYYCTEPGDCCSNVCDTQRHACH